MDLPLFSVRIVAGQGDNKELAIDNSAIL
jgi:hypothetical protein